MLKNRKPWMFLAVAALVAIPFLWPLAKDAWAATDAWFAGRAIRMTPTGTSKCSNAAHRCLQFDDVARPRFWDGTTFTQIVITPSPSPSPGCILIGDGTKWNQLQPGTANQQLTTHITDGGVVSIVWASP